MEKLFTEFKHNSAADWKNQLLKELKGEDYETLRWHNQNGITVEPFYTAEDLKTNYSPAFTHSNWEICVKGNGANGREINAHLLSDLNRGASSIEVVLNGHNAGEVLQQIGLQYIHSSFYLNAQNRKSLFDYLKANQSVADINTSLFSDEFSSQNDLEAWHNASADLSAYTNIKTISFNALPYHNLNCKAYYEIAIILSALVEWLEFYANKQMPAAPITIKTGVSADFFEQMTKLRAIRRLWELLKTEYKINNDLYIITETSSVNKSISDSYNNLLRTTVEAMAAVAGGCNELLVNGFDLFFGNSSELAERMAINQQLILKNESYLDKMADVSCGAYYPETLTDALAQRALEQFKEFEKQGGYFACLSKGLFNSDIKLQAQEQQQKIDSQSNLVIGINKFKNEKEKIEISDEQLNSLQNSTINNPVINYELQNFFKHA